MRMLIDTDVELIAHRCGPRPVAGPTAVLLHGIGMTHRTFERVQPLLATGMDSVSFDMPGFGATRKPARPFSVGDHAAAAAAALDRLQVGSAVLVGHSMGAQFAVELAIQRPELVAGLVLIGPVVDDARRNLPAQARDLGLDTLREPPDANARVLIDYFRGGVGWYLATLKAMFDYPTEDRIALTGCPVIVLRGEHDPVAREPWCRRLAAAAGGPTELVTVPGAAHVVPMTAPDAVAGLVGRLADEVRVRPGIG